MRRRAISWQALRQLARFFEKDSSVEGLDVSSQCLSFEKSMGKKLTANSNEAARDVCAGNGTQIPDTDEEEKGL
jgi:hypothetical protein